MAAARGQVWKVAKPAEEPEVAKAAEPAATTEAPEVTLPRRMPPPPPPPPPRPPPREAAQDSSPQWTADEWKSWEEDRWRGGRWEQDDKRGEWQEDGQKDEWSKKDDEWNKWKWSESGWNSWRSDDDWRQGSSNRADNDKQWSTSSWRGNADDADAGPPIRRGPVECDICKKFFSGGEEWIAIGPKGQRDVRELADPSRNPGRWSFVHTRCVQEEKGHAKSHPNCARPNGPCTDWHLRGKCKRAFDCGHCHFKHPELLEKYPELPPGGVLRRPQRRERLQMLKSAYEQEILSYLEGDPCEKEVKNFLAGNEVSATAEASFRKAIDILMNFYEEDEWKDMLTNWTDLFSNYEQVGELRLKLVQETENLGADQDAGDLLKRFLEKSERFAEVLNNLADAPDSDDPCPCATIEDLMDHVCSAKDLHEVVDRFSELVDL